MDSELPTRPNPEQVDSAESTELNALQDPQDGPKTLAQSLNLAPLKLNSDKKKRTDHVAYSDCLTSRIVAINVGDEKTYHIHSSLLYRDSKRMRKNMTAKFQESRTMMINLVDESAEDFSHYINYLYIPKWEPKCESVADLVYLADLYALGERLISSEFKKVVYRKFDDKLTFWHLDATQVSRLLTIACRDIPERLGEEDDPMREHIFWMAASELPNLQKSDEFKELMREYTEMGMQICLRVGLGRGSGPKLLFS